MTEDITVYSTFEWRWDNSEKAEWIAELYGVLPIQEHLHIEYTRPVKEIECEITVDDDVRGIVEKTVGGLE